MYICDRTRLQQPLDRQRPVALRPRPIWRHLAFRYLGIEAYSPAQPAWGHATWALAQRLVRTVAGGVGSGFIALP